jgi:hypothetical protein
LLFSFVPVETKINNGKQSTLSVSHFDGHADALKQGMWHCPMQQNRGHTRCPWKPPSGGYSLCIAPAAVRATIIKTTIKQYTHFAGCFHGNCDAAVQYRAHCPVEEVQGFTTSHWMLPSNKHLLQ